MSRRGTQSQSSPANSSGWTCQEARRTWHKERLREMAEAFADKKAATVAFIRHAHAGQTRQDGKVPAWHHLERVSELLELVLSHSGEGTPEEWEMIVLASLGHDILEDTSTTRSNIKRHFGPRGLALIDGMTNTFGDENTSPYVAQLIAAEEGVRLIKLADLYDNCTCATHQLFTLGVDWVEGVFVPIARPMIGAVLPTDFVTYPQSAQRLKDMVRVAYALLLADIERVKLRSSGLSVKPREGARERS